MGEKVEPARRCPVCMGEGKLVFMRPSRNDDGTISYNRPTSVPCTECYGSGVSPVTEAP